jgi:hypothetical protein
MWNLPHSNTRQARLYPPDPPFKYVMCIYKIETNFNFSEVWRRRQPKICGSACFGPQRSRAELGAAGSPACAAVPVEQRAEGASAGSAAECQSTGQLAAQEVDQEAG